MGGCVSSTTTAQEVISPASLAIIPGSGPTPTTQPNSPQHNSKLPPAAPKPLSTDIPPAASPSPSSSSSSITNSPNSIKTPESLSDRLKFPPAAASRVTRVDEADESPPVQHQNQPNQKIEKLQMQAAVEEGDESDESDSDDDDDDDIESHSSAANELPEIAEEGETEFVDDGFEASLLKARGRSNTAVTQNTSKHSRSSVVERNSSLGKLLETFSPANAHILVVDDDSSAQDIIAKWLASKRYHVTLVNDGEECIEVLEAAVNDTGIVTDFDLILCDSLMHAPNGRPLLDWSLNNESTRHIPVILMSAESSVQATDRSIRRGASEFLKKPLQRTVLLKTIRTILESIIEHRNTQKLKEFGDTVKEQLMALNLTPQQLGLVNHIQTPSPLTRMELGLPKSPRHGPQPSIGGALLAPVAASELRFELLLLAVDPALTEFSAVFDTPGYKVSPVQSPEEAMEFLDISFKTRSLNNISNGFPGSLFKVHESGMVNGGSISPNSGSPGPDSASIAQRRNQVQPAINLSVVNSSGSLSPLILSPFVADRSLHNDRSFNHLVDLVLIDLDSLDGSDADLGLVANNLLDELNEFCSRRSIPPLPIVFFYSRPANESKVSTALAAITDLLKHNRIDSAIMKPIGRDTLIHKIRLILNNLLVKRKARAFEDRAQLYNKLLTNNRAKRASLISSNSPPNAVSSPALSSHATANNQIGANSASNPALPTSYIQAFQLSSPLPQQPNPSTTLPEFNFPVSTGESKRAFMRKYDNPMKINENDEEEKID